MRLAELQALVRRGESETLEFKQTTGLLQEGFRDLSSFLNRSGGTVLFGIQPSGKISGQQVSDRTWRDIADHVVKIVPAVIPEMVTVDVAADRKVIVVRGTPDPGAIPYTYDGRAYERIGTTTRRMSQERYHRLLLQRQAAASRWENQVASGIATAGLDVARIRAVARQMTPRPPAREPVARLLERLDVVEDGRPLRAAVVLFASDPLPHYPQCELRLARFVGRTTAEFLDHPDPVAGHAFRLLEEAESFLARHLPRRGRVVGMRRQTAPLIPTEALREVLVNAIAHRDYAQPGGAISVAVFDDRVEIDNPGSFPPQLPASKLLGKHRSFPHNPLIASVLYRAGLMEKWGTGGERILAACRTARIRPPTVEEDAGSVRVTFHVRVGRTTTPVSARGAPGLTPQMRRVLRAATTPRSRGELQQVVEVKHASDFLRRYLQPLVARGWVELTLPEAPSSKRQRYRLTAAGKRELARGPRAS